MDDLTSLGEVATDLKRSERLTLDNSSCLDENFCVHGLWTVVRAVPRRTAHLAS